MKKGAESKIFGRGKGIIAKAKQSGMIVKVKPCQVDKTKEAKLQINHVE